MCNMISFVDLFGSDQLGSSMAKIPKPARNSRFDDCVEICRALLKSKPNDTVTLKLMQKALHRGLGGKA